MELTPPQRRTRDGLIGGTRGPALDQGVSERLRERLEWAARELDLGRGGPVWISKDRLREQASCEGWLQAGLLREGPGFRHTRATAAGTLMHRAIQSDVASERQMDVRTVVDRAALRLVEEERAFSAFWTDCDSLDRAETAAAAAGTLVLFREMFPPIDRGWQPVPEQMLRASIAGGNLLLLGKVDLILGRRDRLLIDFKSGLPRPAHAEDMRFYALLATLLFGRAPYRVATVFLTSMEWQAEDVTEDLLVHAAERVVDTVSTAARLASGDEASLRPGLHCNFCPRSRACPSSAAIREVAAPVAPATR